MPLSCKDLEHSFPLSVRLRAVLGFNLSASRAEIHSCSFVMTKTKHISVRPGDKNSTRIFTRLCAPISAGLSQICSDETDGACICHTYSRLYNTSFRLAQMERLLRWNGVSGFMEMQVYRPLPVLCNTISRRPYVEIQMGHTDHLGSIRLSFANIHFLWLERHC